MITMTLDGYVAGPNDGVENPLGDGGERIHEWLYADEAWRAQHGLEGGERTVDSEVMQHTIERTGAVILGRRMYDNAHGWGDDPPFRVPVFVLTHRPEEPLAKNDTTFTFVTEEPARTLELARDAAGGKDVQLAGGASVIQQFMRVGLLDELVVNLSPILLGGGVPLFGSLGAAIRLDPVEVVGSPRVTHIRYQVSEAA
jgi:dihydrofolate reductase